MPRTPREPGRGGSFSAAACRRIRHAATLAEEMGNIHSIKAYGVVWTFHRRPHRPGGNRGGQEQQQNPRQQNARQQRSQERAAAHRARCAAADSFRLGQFFNKWRQSASQGHLRARTQRTQRRPQDSSGAPPKQQMVAPPVLAPPPTPLSPSMQRQPSDAQAECTVRTEGQALLPPPPVPPPPPPAPATSPPPPMQSQQQGGEQMQCERAKNARRRSPAADASPVGAHARMRKLELPPPPPSAPPSPPLSTTPLSSPASSALTTPTKGETTPGPSQNKQSASMRSSSPLGIDSNASSVSVITSIGECELCKNRRRLRKYAEFGDHWICNRCYEEFRSHDTDSD